MPNPTPSRSRRAWLVNVALVLVVFTGVQWWQARPLASGPAPTLAGTMLDGRPFDLAKGQTKTNGEPTLVYFWATWCPVCRMGQEGIDAIARDHPVVGVAMQSGNAADIRKFMAEQGIAFPVLPDPDGALASTWGVAAVPASFVVDRTGRIRFASAGHTTEAGLRARMWAARHID